MRAPCLLALVAVMAALWPSVVLAEGPAAAPPAAPSAIPVTVATPLAKKITQWDEYSGRFQAVERVEVRARVSGFIEQLHFKDGALIKAGELLFTLDKRPFQIAVDVAKSEVERTTAQVDLARSEVERAEPLVCGRSCMRPPTQVDCVPAP